MDVSAAAAPVSRGGGSGLEEPASKRSETRTTELQRRTGRDNTGISEGGNLRLGSPIQTGVSFTRDCHDIAAPCVAPAPRTKPYPPRLRYRNARTESAQNQRFRGVRVGRRGAEQLRRLLGASLWRSRNADAAANADPDAHAGRWHRRLPYQHA